MSTAEHSSAPHNDSAEQAILGTILLGPKVLPSVVGPEHGLRAEHFYRADHGRLLSAMLALLDRGAPIDTITLKAEVTRLKFDGPVAPLIDTVAASVPNVANWPAYVKTVKALAYDRDVRKAGSLLLEAGSTGDRTLIAEAERLLDAGQVDSSPLYTPERQAEDFMERKLAPILCPWPWPRLNELSGGGLRGAQTTVLAGKTNYGKSPAADQILLSGRARGLRVGLYINEMGEQERAQRLMAQLTDGVPSFERIRDDSLTDNERVTVRDFVLERSVPMRNISGWDADSVCRDIARCGWELACVDILHNFLYLDQDRDLARMMGAFASCAKQTGCHIIVVAHLNKGGRGSWGDDENAPPKLADLRGSGMIANLADFVVFVHRDVNEHGKPAPSGTIYLAKGRNAELGGCHVTYNHEAMRFEDARSV